MTKQTNGEIVQTNNLPALPMDDATAAELNDSEGVVILDDYTIRLKQKEKIFLIRYGGLEEEEEVEKLPPDFILRGVESYYTHYDGEKYITCPLDNPPDEKDQRQWNKAGKLLLFHPKYGAGSFLCSFSGFLAFKSYKQKWEQQGINVFGKPIYIGCRMAKSKKGFIYPVPVFLPGWIAGVGQLPEPTDPDPPVVDVDDDANEIKDDIPW